MAKQTHPRGKSIAKVGFYNIYQKNENSVVDPKATVKQIRTTGTKISIYHAKKVVKEGFKNKAEAIIAAQELYKEHLANLIKKIDTK